MLNVNRLIEKRVWKGGGVERRFICVDKDMKTNDHKLLLERGVAAMFM